ncbi:GGDEF domain-containing protein [Maritalea mediterranea]|uniref:GGDEF domain-containing protein n=1 Tax=Maritalea mediterranea TaxID=2909667 RepID=A0ABS9E6P6_9HYPH|nr:GGDEF domain-containing protein [Maritalea mediterranea]MCF4098543.1 GGDEF domain-containing protein [Maritalea mediterranea]
MHRAKPSRIVTSIASIFVAFAVLVVGFIISSLFVLDVASKSANELKLDADQRAVSGLVSREIEDLSQRQSEVAWWDTSVVALSDGVDRTFFADAMLGWFPKEYGIDRSLLMSPDHQVLLHADGEEFTPDAPAQSFAAQTMDLVRQAQAKYIEQRVGKAGAFWIEGDPVRDDPVLYVYDIRRIDGEIGIVVAQAIVPDGEMVLPDGPAHILVSFRPFTPARMAAYQTEIELADFDIRLTPPLDGENVIELSSGLSNQTIYASWVSELPSHGIWAKSAPALALMLAVIAFVMLGVTIAYARLVYRTRKAEARNRYLAGHDALTGLPNRNRFELALKRDIGRNYLKKCAVLCVDLDRFKPVNDTYGHHAGDQVLRVVARRIHDVIGDLGMVARLGGDEFIALLHDAAHKDEVMMLCDRLIESVCQKISFEGHEFYVGASVGVAWWPDDGHSADMVVRRADQALYRAKELGRGRAVQAADLENDHDYTPGFAGHTLLA